MPERRSKKRFPVTLGVRYVTSKPLLVGAGRTVDLSSSGALVGDHHELNVGQRIELSMDWPVTINGVALQLVAAGKVVRSYAGFFALSFARYEFRTAKKQAQSAPGEERQREAG